MAARQGSSRRRYRLDRWRRLKAADFARVFGAKVVAPSGCLVMFACRAESSHAPRAPGGRLGLAVGRGVGNAVVRNRVKRRLREVFRQNLDASAYLDLVVRARPEVVTVGFLDLEGAFKSGLRRLAKRITS